MSNGSQVECTEESSRRKTYLRWILTIPGMLGGLVGFFAAMFGNTLTIHYLFWASVTASQDPRYLLGEIMALTVRLLEGAMLGGALAYGATILIALWLTVDLLWNQKTQTPS